MHGALELHPWTPVEAAALVRIPDSPLELKLLSIDATMCLHGGFSKVVPIHHFVRRSRHLQAADPTTNSIRRPLPLEHVTLLEGNAINLRSV